MFTDVDHKISLFFTARQRSCEGSDFSRVSLGFCLSTDEVTVQDMFKPVHYAIHMGSWYSNEMPSHSSYVFTGICQSSVHGGRVSRRVRVSGGMVPRGGIAFYVGYPGGIPYPLPIQGYTLPPKNSTKASGTHPAGMLLCCSYI